MSEMLGNQYFMARNYSAAAVELEECLKLHPANKSIRKKLIVCYTQIGKVQHALNEFYSLVQEDIKFIAETDPIRDDCPCPELVAKIEKLNPANSGSMEYNIMTGIMWLYCDASKSLPYFENAAKMEPGNPIFSNIASLIKYYIQSETKIVTS
ncbi:MAG: hypothetical protein V1720_07950 [bacterium]